MANKQVQLKECAGSNTYNNLFPAVSSQVLGIVGIDNNGNIVTEFQKIGQNYYNSESGFLNAPLQVGIEYKTIKKFLNKPVYMKVFSIPTGNITITSASYDFEVSNLNISNIENVVYIYATTKGYDKNSNKVFYDDSTWITNVTANKITVRYFSNGVKRFSTDLPNYLILEYTKTTD